MCDLWWCKVPLTPPTPPNPLSNLPHLLSTNLNRLLRKIHVTQAVHRNQVDMRMGHFQPDHCDADARTGHNRFQGTGNFFGKNVHVGQGLVIEVVDVVDFLLGHYEGVALGHGANVQKREKALILGYFVAGDFAIDDLGENGRHDGLR